MTRTSPWLLVAVAVIGGVVGFGIDQLLTAGGRATFTPSTMLPILLVLLGAITVILALPIRRATRDGAAASIDPFRAVRVVVLAKAGSLTGAGITGVGLGLLVFVLTRPVSPSLGSMGAVIATTVGAAALVAAGLIAEHLCTIRKDDDDDQPGPEEPGFGLSHH